jgi:hypothetical protein
MQAHGQSSALSTACFTLHVSIYFFITVFVEQRQQQLRALCTQQ